MELSRLRRELRKGGYPIFEEALALFDAIDQVRENAEQYEELLASGTYPTEGDIVQWLIESKDQLVTTLLSLPSVDLYGLLSAILQRQSYEAVLHELEAWRKQSEEAHARLQEELGDLDESPF